MFEKKEIHLKTNVNKMAIIQYFARVLGVNNMSVKKLLEFEPRPLVDPSTKIALLWSAKSGSAFALKWFFAQANLLDAANFYRPWVHKFREDVFYNSKMYLDAIEQLLTENYMCFKVVRSPFSRAVSSYTHALKYGYENDELSRYLGRKITDDSGFSFDEFVNYLATIDISKCNIHHREQIHPLEVAGLLVPDHVVKLEDSIKTLGDLEKKYNLKRTPLESFRESPHNTRRISGDDFCGMIRYKPKDEAFFSYENFYNDEMVDKVVSIYKKDFNAYGYPEYL